MTVVLQKQGRQKTAMVPSTTSIAGEFVVEKSSNDVFFFGWKGAQDGPRGTQDRPKRLPRRPKRRPRGLQDSSRALQDGPGSAEEERGHRGAA